MISRDVDCCCAGLGWVEGFNGDNGIKKNGFVFVGINVV
jgi:hypothetical protein